MKVSKFLKLDGKFKLSGFLNPRIGGPYGYSSHLISKNTTIESFMQALAANIQYAAVRPFASLDLQSVNQWEFSLETIELLAECETQFDYLDYSCLIPSFAGRGTIYTLIGQERILDTESWKYSTWAATDTKTSVGDLLHMLRGFFQARLVRREISEWKLVFILKTTWEAENPEFKRYDIFLPPAKWIEEHASFKKGQFAV
ncbi:MAG: hypothetical protein FGM57_03735 [Candidatus Taylorbacteria bacterium]|nr:hypothetical protein [Candidatus Taylorbacteria bacterium]